MDHPTRATARDLAQWAQRFHALSDVTRLALVLRLREGERCVCDLTDLLDAAQSRLSFHLKVLREAGLIEWRREGRWSYYRLRAEALSELDQTLKRFEPGAAAGLPTSGGAQCCA